MSEEPKPAKKAVKKRGKRTKPKAGKFCDIRMSIIVRALKGHNFLETAATLAGVHRNTLYNWITWGADKEETKDGKTKVIEGKEPYRTFWLAVEKAKAVSESVLVSGVAKSGWKGKLHILQRRHRDNWAETRKVQLTGKDDGPIKTEGPPPVINLSITGEALEKFFFEQPPETGA